MTTPGGPFLPLSIKVELLVNGTFVDISSYVMQRDGIVITGGRSSASDQSSPATMTLTLKNQDGRFTPQYASGAYYPYLQRDTQIRVGVTAFSATGSFYSGYRFYGEVTDWPPLASVSGSDKYVMITATGPLRRVNVGGGYGSALARYYGSLTGSAVPIAYWPCEEDPQTTQLQPGLAGGQVMNITAGTPTWKADKTINGSAPIGYLNYSTWDGLTGSFGASGNDLFTVPGTYTWYASTTTVDARCWGAGGGGGGGCLFNGHLSGGGGGGEFGENTTLAVTPGNPYTIVVGKGGAGGGVGSFNVGFNGTGGGASSVAGDSATVSAAGGGAGSGCQPGGPGLGGPGGSGSGNPTDFTGGAGASGGTNGGGGGGSAGTAANGNAGSSSGAGGAAVTGGGSGGAGGIGNLPGNLPTAGPGGGGGGGGSSNKGGNGYAGQVQMIYTPPAAPPANVLRAIVVVPKHGGNNGKVLLRMLTGGTIARVDVQYSKANGGCLVVLGYNISNTLLFTSANACSNLNGAGTLISVELTPSGSAVKYNITGFAPGTINRKGNVSGTVASSSLGNVSEVLAGPNGDISNTAIGHISVQYALIPIEQVADSLNGHVQEMTVDRLIRLAAESALDSEPVFAEGSDHWGFERGTQGWTASNATIAHSGAFSSGKVRVVPFAPGGFLSNGGMGQANQAGAISAWESFTGIAPQNTRTYFAGSPWNVTTDLQTMIANGLLIHISLQPAFNPPTQSDFNAMQSFMQALKAAGANCEVTLWGEPFFSGLTSAQYITMVQFYAAAVRPYYPLAFVTSLTSVYNNNENSYYPGDAYIDVVACDVYAGTYYAGQYPDQAAQIADNAMPRKKFSIWEFNALCANENFLVQPQSGFENGGGGSTGTWIATTGAPNLTATTAQAHSGTASMQMKATATGTMSASHCGAGSITTQGLPAVSGDPVTVTAWFRAAATPETCTVGINWYTSAGALISSSTGTGVTDSTTGWTQATETANAPATTGYCRAAVTSSAAAINEIHYIDDVSLTNANDLSNAQVQAFFSFLQGYMSDRYLNGLPKGDLMFFNGGQDVNACIVQNSADFRIPFFTALQQGTSLASGGGGHCLAMTSAGGAGQWATSSPSGLNGQPVNNGDYVGAAADVAAPAGNAATLNDVGININWFNSSGTGLSTTGGAPYTLAPGATQTIKVSGNAPSGAAYFNLSVVDNETVAAGLVLQIDNVRVSTRMGSQERKALREFIRDIQTLEQGLVADSKKLLGLKFRSRISLINQKPALILDYSQGQVANDYQQGGGQSSGGGPTAPLAPVFDDLLSVNLVEIRRYKGSKVTQLAAAQLAMLQTAATPKIYRKLLRVIAEKDAQLLALAQHLLNLGAFAGERYPTIAVNLLRAGLPGNSMGQIMNTAACVEIGDFVQMINLPFYFPSATAKQLVIGYTEYINAYEWSITWNCAPESPYELVSTSLRRW